MSRLGAAVRAVVALLMLRRLLRLLSRDGRSPAAEPAAGTAAEPPAGTAADRRAVALALVTSIAGSFGFALCYLLDSGPQGQAATLGVALGALALALGIWSRRLVPRRLVVEPREPMQPPEPERAAAARALARPVARRGFLLRMLGLALGALGLAALLPAASLGPAPGNALRTTAWRRGTRLVTRDGEPVRLDSLPVGGTVSVFPEGEIEEVDAQVILIRLATADLRPAAGREAWTPAGYIGFSQICTHAGCPVGLYEQVSKRLLCPCHQSVFDVLDGARPVGGPAIRALPQLPLSIGEDGILVARGDFPEPPGAGHWRPAS